MILFYVRSYDRIKSGSRVTVNYRGSGRWCPGGIAKENRDGSFYIEFDDGDADNNVTVDFIRKSDVSKKDAPIVFKIKSRVLAQRPQKTIWYEIIP